MSKPYSALEWTNDMVFEFLDLYKTEPILYNSQHPAYKNHIQVHKAWNRIKNSFSADIPLIELKKKKESLMASFRHHLRKRKASIRSGIGSDEVYTPIWYAYEAMESFLGPLYDCEPAMVKMEVESTFLQEPEYEEHSNTQDDNSNNYDASPTTTFTPQQSSPLRLEERKNLRELRYAKRKMDEAFEIFQNMGKQCDDECELYGRLLTKKLKRVALSAREQVMYEIDGILLRAKQRSQGVNFTVRSSYSQPTSTSVHLSGGVYVQSSSPTSVMPDLQEKPFQGSVVKTEQNKF